MRSALSIPMWWWRWSGWAVVAVATALTAHSVPAQVAVGLLMALSAVAVMCVDDRFSMRVSTTAVLTATVLGLACVLIAPSGLGEIPVFAAASRITFPIEHGRGRLFVVLDTIAVAAVVGFVSQSLVGLLAGLGIPLLAQRAAERRELIVSRDQARALLAEVQEGREAESQAAALSERTRIARELHDVLAHTLAGLSLQLQAVRAIAAREAVGASVLEPLDRAAALAQDGLQEARSVVGALRDPVGLGLDAIPALVERHPGEVALQLDGSPVAVPPEAGHAAYRAVQEALTNAARYAPGAAVTVQIQYRADGVSVRVTDSGLPAGRSAVASSGTGLGLAGMDERVRSAGGSLTAGPHAGGGWQVEVRVPVLAGSPA